MTITIQSQTSGRTYTITRARNGGIYCSCPSWKYQRIAPAARTCKHTRTVMALTAA